MNTIKMHFKHHGEPYAINCDWLQFSVMLLDLEPLFKCPEGYRIDMCQGNNIFKHRALVYDNQGRKLLTLLWHPYSSVLNPFTMTVQVANESLYAGQIKNSLALLHNIVACQFNSIGRFDICCDFNMTNKRLGIVKNLNSGAAYVERKTEGSTFWHEVKQNGFKHKQLHCLSWGSKTTEIKVKLYNKTRELGLPETTEPEKPWIIKEWEAAKLDKLKTWRLEFSLKSNGQLRWNDRQITLDEISNPYWLALTYCDLYETRFITRFNEGKKSGHHNNDKRFYLLDLPKDGERLYWQESINHRTESTPAVKLLRTLIANITNEALAMDKIAFFSYRNTIQDIIHHNDLYNYFEHVFGEPSNIFLDKIQAQIGSGINEKIASPTQLMA